MPNTYSFGRFQLDLRSRILSKDGNPVALQPKAVDILCILVARVGKVVSKEELLDEVWRNTHVEEGNLSKLVFLLRQKLGPKEDGGPWIETFPKRGYRFVPPAFRDIRETLDQAPECIAVLPFLDGSSDGRLGPWCEGLTEGLTRSLGRTGAFRVVTIPVAGSAAAPPLSLSRAFETLPAQVVVTGKVHAQEPNLALEVSVWTAAGHEPAWQWSGVMPPHQLQAIQEELSSNIAHDLAGISLPRLKAQPPNTRAFERYLQGRYLWNRRPGSVVWEALHAFEDAVQLDPRFALAWAGLADVYATLGSWESGVMPHGTAQAKAREYASRAIGLDPGLAEAHTTLAYTALHHDWDLETAVRGFQHALGLHPQCGAAHHWIAHALVAAGKEQEAQAHGDLALSIEPLNLVFHAHQAWHHFMGRRPELAVEKAERLIGIEPGFHWGHLFRGWGEEALGRLGPACDALEKAVELSGNHPVMRASLGRALALAGHRSEATQILADLAKVDSGNGLFSYEIALIHLALGENNEAFQALELAVQVRSGWIAYLAADPRLDPIRSLPGFSDFPNLRLPYQFPGGFEGWSDPRG